MTPNLLWILNGNMRIPFSNFLELGEEHSERQLEQAILTRIDPFLREMGGMSAFVGS
jgi:predicted nuclease of restriction endonuclease-like (RecB) superfamily